jgi:hypothetical protein
MPTTECGLNGNLLLSEKFSGEANTVKTYANLPIINGII